MGYGLKIYHGIRLSISTIAIIGCSNFTSVFCNISAAAQTARKGYFTFAGFADTYYHCFAHIYRINGDGSSFCGYASLDAFDGGDAGLDELFEFGYVLSKLGEVTGGGCFCPVL